MDQLVFKVVNGQLVVSRAASSASASAIADIPQSLVQFTSLLADHEIPVHETENDSEMIWEFPESMSDSVAGISFSLEDAEDSPLSFQQSEFTSWLQNESEQSFPSFSPSIVSVPAVFNALNLMLAGSEQTFTQLMTPLSLGMNPELVEYGYRVSVQDTLEGMVVLYSLGAGLTRNLYRVTLRPLTYLQLREKTRSRTAQVDLREDESEDREKKLDPSDAGSYSIWPKSFSGFITSRGDKWFGEGKVKEESAGDESWLVLMIITWLSSKAVSL
ncbi:MAG: hypothetical protein ACR2PX_06425 [Endozoicomonas sp.]|uniref:hypothetical protein n=1 Tax=Endozoicomonas sp. TaxID=1892382 RepID=UPI003D9B2B0C